MAEPAAVAAGSAAGGLVLIVGGWLLRVLALREINRVDGLLQQHSNDINELKSAAARRSDIEVLRNDLLQYHKERMDEIRRVHERIDRLVERD
jgi:hypothetical protein